jgi:hypothetical protein
MRRKKIRRRIEKHITTNIPCAVVEYYEWFKMDRRIENKVYEMIILNVRNNNLEHIEMRPSELALFRLNIHGFEKVVHTPDGKVWEKGNFKKLITDLKTPKK